MTTRKPGARPKRSGYLQNEYPKGRGWLKCELCGYPLRDHEMDTHPSPARSGKDD